VTDRNKKMIFDKIMSAGSEETVEGEPPLEVVVGNALGSKLMFNDKFVDLVPYTKASVARVTLE
jgi:cytoskeleton protein RodZ